MTKLYTLVQRFLEAFPEYRDNDKKLIWAIWKRQGLTEANVISYKSFLSESVSLESITRARRKVQETNPKLQGSDYIKRARAEKAEEKGNFIYTESLEEKKELNESMKKYAAEHHEKVANEQTQQNENKLF